MSSEPSLEGASKKLLEALAIVTNEYSSPYHARLAKNIPSKEFLKISAVFLRVAIKLKEFQTFWFDSYKKGKDAFTQNIDIELIESGKLDMVLFKKIIHRSSRGEDFLRALKRIRFYAVDFLQKSINQKSKATGTAEDFLGMLIDPLIVTVEGDLIRLKGRIERCNLYFQNKLNRQMFLLAIVSVLASITALAIALVPHIQSLIQQLMQ